MRYAGPQATWQNVSPPPGRAPTSSNTMTYPIVEPPTLRGGDYQDKLDQALLREAEIQAVAQMGWYPTTTPTNGDTPSMSTLSEKVVHRRSA